MRHDNPHHAHPPPPHPRDTRVPVLPSTSPANLYRAKRVVSICGDRWGAVLRVPWWAPGGLGVRGWNTIRPPWIIWFGGWNVQPEVWIIWFGGWNTQPEVWIIWFGGVEHPAGAMDNLVWGWNTPRRKNDTMDKKWIING